MLLPRAAGGGAGAVAALIVPATAEPMLPPEETSRSLAHPHENEPVLMAPLPDASDGEAPTASPLTVEETTPPSPPETVAAVAPETPSVAAVPRVEEEVSASEPPGQIADELPVGHQAVADAGPPPVPKLAVEALDAFADAPTEGVFTKTPAESQHQPKLVELIPEVLPDPPKLPALSPSMAPALRPLLIEHFPPPPPDTPTRAAVAPAPQTPPIITPPPPVPSPEPEPPSPRAPPDAPDEKPAPGESRPFFPPPTSSAPSSSTALAADAIELAPEAPRRYAPVPRPSSTPTHIERRYLRLAFRAAVALCVGAACLLLALLLLYRWVDPPASTLMLGQRLTGTAITQRWVPLERISPSLAAAVISSEDGHFCRHHGVDWGELKEAIESAGDGIARGGSTISMQVVKNLFLWPSRSYVRKAIEIPLAYAMEALWPKRRILEVYLNIAEWGPGVFGAEAAARYHFRKSALALNAREAALLAVSLPNPYDRQAGRPGPGTVRLADNLLLRMRAAQPSTACLRTGAGRS
jgi:monofunctional biosynthetic peptidoglycan transglycosylase